MLEAMVDLETNGTGNKAVILSIGAVMMNFMDYTVVEGSDFYVNVDRQSCIDIGLLEDASTIAWWAKQSPEAKAALLVQPIVPIKEALTKFSAWMLGHRPVYGNGATFDNVILRNAYEHARIPCPWKFWEDSCYRTIKNRFGRSGDAPPPNLCKHNALEDARYQAKHLCNIYKRIDGALQTG